MDKNNLPSFLKPGMTIGLCAPSFGCSDTPYKERYDEAKKKFIKLGYKIKETPSCNKYDDIASAPREIRAQEFMDQMLDDEVDFVISCGGGEIMCEILPFIDFEKIKNCPKKKFFMGYSDNTNLTFTLPIFANVPAIYGECVASFGYKKWDEHIKNAYNIISGKTDTQKSNPKKYDLSKKEERPLVSNKATIKTCWKRYDFPNQETTIKGLSIGGCLDIINLFYGTKWGQIDKYLEAHKDEGFIWFIESCDLNIVSQKRAYWQLKQSGFLKYAKAIVIGRPLNTTELFGHTYEDMIKELKDLNLPIIYDFDIGHVGPMNTLITGVPTEVHYSPKLKECYIKQTLK